LYVIYYEHALIKKKIRDYKEKLDEEVLRNVTDANRYDLILYDIAKKRFEEQIDSMGRDYFDEKVSFQL